MMTNVDIIQTDCLEWLQAQPADSVDFVIGSPPYAGKGERYDGARRKWSTAEWVVWMTLITVEAVRVCRGHVVWIANGFVHDGRYEPACEGLISSIYSTAADSVACERPVVWHKNAPPNRRDWFGNDWEYCLAFKKAGVRPAFDWQAVGHEPKYTDGGRFRQRGANGERRLGSEYPKGKLAHPRDVLRVTVGGGHLGSKLAHENEAPFPEKLVEPFILACSPTGGVVLDPFCGSGTTGAVALQHGRRFVGLDVRENQVDLSRRRIFGEGRTESPPSAA